VVPVIVDRRIGLCVELVAPEALHEEVVDEALHVVRARLDSELGNLRHCDLGFEAGQLPSDDGDAARELHRLLVGQTGDRGADVVIGELPYRRLAPVDVDRVLAARLEQ
jgi:hypothetical protein